MKAWNRFPLCAVIVSAALLVPWAAIAASTKSHDVVVYGGTAGGTIAAIAAADEGRTVALLEPRFHIGGMVSGGLGRTDFGKQDVIGGLSRAFFERVGERYGESLSWYFEPHVAEEVFREWLSEAGVDVFFGQRLAFVWKQGARIKAIRTAKGGVFHGKVFIDASYEGDLLPKAGTAYTWGRESCDVYGESLAGRIALSPKHQFPFPVSPYDGQGNLLPLIYAGDAGEPGAGDRKVQAYNFRLCMTQQPDNRVPWPKPEGYDPNRYEILRRYLEKAPDLAMEDLMILSPMPNGKTDTNNRGPISTDYIGGSWAYPDADAAHREAIWEEHKRYQQGFYYFLANDPGVPANLRREANEWGLAKDEFTDTDHWPHQLYIREARRLIGAYVMTQQDLQTQRTKPDSIGMGSYNSDSHHVQRIAVEDAAELPDGAPDALKQAGPFMLNEGDMQVPVQPYEIAYRALLPEPGQCTNFLVTCCVSASHVAYSSMRMEPQYMIMGHAAGVAAAQAIRQGTSLQGINVSALQERLREQRQILSLDDVGGPYVDAGKLPGVVVDNTQAEVVGDWKVSRSVTPYVGVDYLDDGNEGKSGKRIRFTPQLSATGEYEIRIAYTASANRATNVTVTVHTSRGPVSATLNQRQHPGRHAPFFSLGKYHLWPEADTSVEIHAEGTDGCVVVDAVQWLPVE